MSLSRYIVGDEYNSEEHMLNLLRFLSMIGIDSREWFIRMSVDDLLRWVDLYKRCKQDKR